MPLERQCIGVCPLLGYHKHRGSLRLGLSTKKAHLCSRRQPGRCKTPRRKWKFIRPPFRTVQSDANGRGTCALPPRLPPRGCVSRCRSVVPQHFEIDIIEADVPTDHTIREPIRLANPKSDLSERRDDFRLRTPRGRVKIDVIQFDGGRDTIWRRRTVLASRSDADRQYDQPNCTCAS